MSAKRYFFLVSSVSCILGVWLIVIVGLRRFPEVSQQRCTLLEGYDQVYTVMNIVDTTLACIIPSVLICALNYATIRRYQSCKRCFQASGINSRASIDARSLKSYQACTSSQAVAMGEIVPLSEAKSKSSHAMHSREIVPLCESKSNSCQKISIREIVPLVATKFRSTRQV